MVTECPQLNTGEVKRFPAPREFAEARQRWL